MVALHDTFIVSFLYDLIWKINSINLNDEFICFV